MIRALKYILMASSVAVIFGCASPTVVSVRQLGDSDLTCDQLKRAYSEANQFEENARKERTVTGTNVAAALIFWPALIATYANTEEAINAAKDRRINLVKIADEKNCKL
jgi:hypothetical protein